MKSATSLSDSSDHASRRGRDSEWSPAPPGAAPRTTRPAGSRCSSRRTTTGARTVVYPPVSLRVRPARPRYVAVLARLRRHRQQRCSVTGRRTRSRTAARSTSPPRSPRPSSARSSPRAAPASRPVSGGVGVGVTSATGGAVDSAGSGPPPVHPATSATPSTAGTTRRCHALPAVLPRPRMRENLPIPDAPDRDRRRSVDRRPLEVSGARAAPWTRPRARRPPPPPARARAAPPGATPRARRARAPGRRRRLPPTSPALPRSSRRTAAAMPTA